MRFTLCLAVMVLVLPAGAAAAPSAGGAPASPLPAVTSVACKSKCSGSFAKPGSVVALKGAELADVVSVTFTGTRPAGDETTAKPRKATAKQVLVVVPAGTVKGPVVVTDSGGQASAPSPALNVTTPAVPKKTDGPIATVVTGRKAFIDGEREPTLTYRLNTRDAADVTVSVVSQASSKEIVETFDQGEVEPGEDEEVSWDGTVDDAAAPEGRYAFVVAAVGPDGVQASTAQSSASDTFRLLGHKFPIRGKHDYGTGSGTRFGAGRSGHSHQGQDVFAKCGTPLVAARGGTVKINRFQGNAGNYLVIDGEDTDVDYAYMHLRDVALVAKGERVHTGQAIGFVGDTGDAHGCHLHFEEWAGPGWYTGGSPFDPLPDLRAWDALS